MSKESEKLIETPDSRQKSVGEWVTLAVSNADAALRLASGKRFDTQALYFTQQSMEAAVKAKRRASGNTHEDVYGHNILKGLFTNLMETIVESGGMEYANFILSEHYFTDREYDVIKHLSEAISATEAPRARDADNSEQRDLADKLFESAIYTSPQEVQILLDMLRKVGKHLKGVPRYLKPIRNKQLIIDLALFQKDPCQTLAKQIIDQAIDPALRRSFHREEQEFLEGMEHTLEILIEQQGKQTERVDGNQIIRLMQQFMSKQTADLGILTIGALVWPHESYPRYPAPPKAPDSVFEAARKGPGGRRMLGIRHYSTELGVICHLGRLTRECKNTALLLQKSFNEGWL